ncbi:MAG: hypothetical protein IBJ10_07825 [Phycisphaerales bacterium]|nr:hypothetical protein [Phycisphaerales bacterium]
MTRAVRSRLGRLTAATLCLACVVWVAVVSVSGPAVARQVVPPGNAQAMQTLATLLTPAAWAVGGVTPEQAQGVLEWVAAEHAGAVATMRQKAADADAYAEQLAAATDMLQRGGATQERLAAQESARGGVDASAAAVRAARETLVEALLDGIEDIAGAENAAMARRWTANAMRKVPDAFKALDLDEEGWRALTSAHRRAQRGEELSGPQAAALSAAGAQSAVAGGRLDNGVAAMSAWLVGVAIGQP